MSFHANYWAYALTLRGAILADEAHRLRNVYRKTSKLASGIANAVESSPMFAEAICKLEGFAYAPSDRVYWQCGRSTEKHFTYITTHTLTREQIRKFSDEVGDGRSLIVMCAAFRVKNLDAFPNLTVKKIPKTVLARCEWGHDDYSLEVRHLPIKPAEEGPPSGLSADASAGASKKPRTRADRRGQTTLFDMDGDKRSQQ